MIEPDCECKTWARDNPPLWSGHHPTCQRYDAVAEVRAVIEPLLAGIEKWAADEDGIHWGAWDAYERACIAIGQPHRSKKEQPT